MKKTILLNLVVLLLTVALAPAATRLVPDEYATIQDAIDAAVDGDMVIVAPATYTGNGNRDIDFDGKAITIRSENGPETCIIDCNGIEDEPHRGFYFHKGEDANSALSGFTIINGYAGYGGAIYCVSSHPTITNCTFRNNTAKYWGEFSTLTPHENRTSMVNDDGEVHINIPPPLPGWRGKGGGICCRLSSPTLTNCKFIGNSAIEYGGGIYNYYNSSPILTNCTFTANSASYGGAIRNSSGSPILTNCTFVANSASSGGAIHNSSSSPSLFNCIFNGNSAGWDGGCMSNYGCNPMLTNCTFNKNSARYNGGVIFNTGSDATLSNCILWGNTATKGNEIYLDYYSDFMGREYPSTINVDYSGVDGGAAEVYVDDGCTLNWGDGNIDADPCFISSGYWDVNSVWVDGDYHLLSYSACIDAGDPNYIADPNEKDLDGKPRVIGGRIDMGVYEFQRPCVLHVDVDATGANNGSSWADAYNDLQDALTVVQTGDEIRVAQGIYMPGPPGPTGPTGPPDPPEPPTGSVPPLPLMSLAGGAQVQVTSANRKAKFQLKNGVTIKGGYAGAGEPDPNARDIELYETILSGDLAGNDRDVNDPQDFLNDPCRAENSYHVVTASGTNETAVLDGFTITAGNANGGWSDRTNCGGGMFNVSGSPTITNCTFTKNLARDGGGMYNYEDSNPMLTNCTFRANLADRDGGGIANFYHSSPTLTNCAFSGNSAKYGGGMDNTRSNPTLTDCTFIGNSADGVGGGISNLFYSGPILSNCTFSENSAGAGGGFFCEYAPPPPVAGFANGRFAENPYTPVFYNSGDANITMANNTIVGNSPGDYTGGMDDFGSQSILTNCTFTANSANMGNGGGIYSSYGSPTLLNCAFSGNSAKYDGGGMANRSSNPTLANCTFIGNSAKRAGGMYNSGSSPTLTNCTFRGNLAKYGGGMYNWSKSRPALTNCIFINNSVEKTGGGISNRGFSNPKLTNCTFISNSAHIGGGMFIECFSGSTVINCTFTKNYSDLRGGGIYSGLTRPPGSSISFPVITNCILYGNMPDEIYVDELTQVIWTPVVTFSDVQGGWAGKGNIDADPLFVEPGYWDANGLWVDGDYHLLAGSPCIDAGDPNYLSEPNETDLDGRPRIIGGRIDMGAYEFFNTRPLADAGPEKVVECACNTNEGTKVTLDGTGSYDTDGDMLTYIWTGPFIESPAQGATPTVTLKDGCPGEYVITLVVNDGTEDSAPNDVMITVVDTTPPEFALSVSPTVLWPPNHKMVKITPTWTVNDNCDAMPGVSLVSISINESKTKGNGRTDDDVKIGDDGSLYLRAERSGKGTDRVYTITYRAVDDCGNATLRSATVTVPHDRR